MKKKKKKKKKMLERIREAYNNNKAPKKTIWGLHFSLLYFIGNKRPFGNAYTCASQIKDFLKTANVIVGASFPDVLSDYYALRLLIGIIYTVGPHHT